MHLRRRRRCAQGYAIDRVHMPSTMFEHLAMLDFETVPCHFADEPGLASFS